MGGISTFGISMAIGFPGSYSRNDSAVRISQRFITPTDSAVNPSGGPNGSVNFGDALFLNPAGPQASVGGNYSNLINAQADSLTPSMSYSGTTNAIFAGFAAREVKTLLSYVPAPGTQATLGYYLAGEMADCIVQGSCPVVYGNPKAAAAPIAGGPVYLRISTNGAGTVVGTIEPAADGAHTLQLTNCVFSTGVITTDINGVTIIEVTLINRNVA
jgi:hypothetical protein